MTAVGLASAQGFPASTDRDTSLALHAHFPLTTEAPGYTRLPSTDADHTEPATLPNSVCRQVRHQFMGTDEPDVHLLGHAVRVVVKIDPGNLRTTTKYRL